MSMYLLYAWFLKRPKQGVRSLGTGGTDSWELIYCKTEPCLQPPVITFLM